MSFWKNYIIIIYHLPLPFHFPNPSKITAYKSRSLSQKQKKFKNKQDWNTFRSLTTKYKENDLQDCKDLCSLNLLQCCVSNVMKCHEMTWMTWNDKKSHKTLSNILGIRHSTNRSLFLPATWAAQLLLSQYLYPSQWCKKKLDKWVRHFLSTKFVYLIKAPFGNSVKSRGI